MSFKKFAALAAIVLFAGWYLFNRPRESAQAVNEVVDKGADGFNSLMIFLTALGGVGVIAVVLVIVYFGFIKK